MNWRGSRKSSCRPGGRRQWPWNSTAMPSPILTRQRTTGWCRRAGTKSKSATARAIYPCTRRQTGEVPGFPVAPASWHGIAWNLPAISMFGSCLRPHAAGLFCMPRPPRNFFIVIWSVVVNGPAPETGIGQVSSIYGLVFQDGPLRRAVFLYGLLFFHEATMGGAGCWLPGNLP